MSLLTIWFVYEFDNEEGCTGIYRNTTLQYKRPENGPCFQTIFCSYDYDLVYRCLIENHLYTIVQLIHFK